MLKVISTSMQGSFNIKQDKTVTQVKPETSASSDKQLVARVQKGDRRAFDLLVIKYQKRIIALSYRFVNDPMEAQDIAQEAFIKAFRAAPGFRGDSAFYTWLYRITINTAKNYLQSRGRRAPLHDMDVDNEEQFVADQNLENNASPEALMQRDQLKSVIFSCMEKLPDELQQAIKLREIDGMSYEDIAIAMGCPVGTVRSRIFRAREAIDKHIQPLVEQSA